MDISCHRPFLPCTSLEPAVIPPLRLQASHCITFRIMCDVPSTAVFCSESIECFPGTVSKLFLKLLVTIPVAPIIAGTIVQFRFHIRCISIHKLSYFNFFSASFYYYYYYYHHHHHLRLFSNRTNCSCLEYLPGIFNICENNSALS